MEGDSLKVIQAVNKLRPRTTMFVHIIEEIHVVKSSMVFCSFNHVKRGGNKLGHTLARRAVLAADIDVWLEDLPLIWMMYSNMIYNNKFTYLFPQKR